ncbi:uncharacterized protein LOC116106625 [Pistacia vera]|uniref:uncharacterized protein LOC116106625 n=1 Tax=Pistacia vera TaxID=55513 RepID=UPI00126392F4|nr:uncharacterized protein LOC116106625 [Pistacia vera]
MLQQFLGLANYIREYVSNLANVINGLTLKVSDKVPWVLTLEDANCVKRTKVLTKQLKPLKLPEDEDKLIIESDASHLYWGGGRGVLKAKGTDNIERIVRYASGNFSPAEINYHVHEKEVLAAKEYILQKICRIMADKKETGNHFSCSKCKQRGHLRRNCPWRITSTSKVIAKKEKTVDKQVASSSKQVTTVKQVEGKNRDYDSDTSDRRNPKFQRLKGETSMKRNTFEKRVTLKKETTHKKGIVC